jgi:hypothetical protein
VAAFALLPLARVAGAVDCAFEDVNDNGIFDIGDVLVTDAQWIGGAAFVSNNPFVVPVGCDKTLVGGLAVTQGVRVTATKITFLGSLDYVPPGGRGVAFIADPTAVPAPNLGNGDLRVGNGVNLALIRAGGVNTLSANTFAVAQKSVALVGTGACTFNNADISGVAPMQNTKVGILCTGDIVFRSTTVVGSKVNIQSRTGQIDARGGGGELSLAALCDDPATNATGGNGNNVIDAPDFPCQLNLAGVVFFANAAELAAACQITPGNNKFRAFNDPFLMIAGAGAGNNVDVRGASIVGRYRVTLSAEDGDLLTQGAIIDHGEQLGITPPGGAKIWLFANPTTVVRLPVDREDFLGPSTGSSNVADACYQSPNPVQVGQNAGGLISVTGVTAPAPCKQNPADFVPVLNGIF